ncbi:hypothetical protein [Methylocaldum sp. 14B]|jgi:hypothetical protein|uniref:hypothetical protein n=1 Tax=unclassified Methylocaldum TaxID=2622260 RepID=UPI001180C8FC|nr:hypothetical protein [Methylocaldum sp. 14B]
MKKMLVLVGSLGIATVLGWGYWVSLSDAQHWLLFNKRIAEIHADLLLNRNTTVMVPDELIDVQISAYPGWVLFSPHDEEHSFVLAYAPEKKPEPFAADGVTRQWRQVNPRWYELLPN